MGTPIEDGSVQGGNPDEGGAPGHNPAWDEVLNLLPEQFHSVVTPHFQKWDQSAQSRIEQANESLKQYEAYKPFAEHGIDSNDIEQGLRLFWEINNNPQNVYQALQNAYKFDQQPGSQPNNPDPQEPEGEGLNLPPEIMEKLQNHDGVLQAVSQIILNDAQQKQDAAADAELDRELNELKEKHGEYDEDYVLAKMQLGMSGDDAIKSYQAFVQRVTPQPFAPTLLGNSGGGSGLPSNAIDPTKLSGKETRNLVAQMLAAAKNQP